MLKSIILAASLASTLGASAAFAAPPPAARPVVVDRHYVAPRPYARWDLLGEVRVDGRRAGASTLFVGRDAGPMTRLRLVVQRGDLGMKTVKVTFGNGQTFVTAMSGASAIIDLPGEARNVRSIDIDAPPSLRRSRSIVAISGANASPPRHAYYR